MNRLLLIICLFSQMRVLSQKGELLPGVSFDSSYTVIGIGQGFGKPVDSMERFWFILENPEDMKRIQREWVLKDRIKLPGMEFVDIDLYVIQGKRLAARTGLIVPKWGIASDGLGGWYRFDTAKLAVLHAGHPLRFHSEHRRFQTFNEYAAYGNSELNDPKLLFFFEPDIRFQGSFDIISSRNRDPNSPIFVLRDINRELEVLGPKGTWEAAQSMTDSFNITHEDSVKVQVHGSRVIYDRYASLIRYKGPWRPEPIEITLFWRDDQ